MIVAIQATRNFNDYPVFLSGIGRAMRSMDQDDKVLEVYSAGPVNLNAMALEFLNVSEQGLKARGIKHKLIKIPPTWLEDNITKIDYFAFFSNPKEPQSPIVKIADAKDVPVGIFRYYKN